MTYCLWKYTNHTSLFQKCQCLWVLEYSIFPTNDWKVVEGLFSQFLPFSQTTLFDDRQGNASCQWLDRVGTHWWCVGHLSSLATELHMLRSKSEMRSTLSVWFCLKKMPSPNWGNLRLIGHEGFGVWITGVQYRFWGFPISHEGLVSHFKVQDYSSLLCSSTI